MWGRSPCPHGYPVDSAPLIEKTFLSLLNFDVTLSINLGAHVYGFVGVGIADWPKFCHILDCIFFFCMIFSLSIVLRLIHVALCTSNLLLLTVAWSPWCVFIILTHPFPGMDNQAVSSPDPDLATPSPHSTSLNIFLCALSQCEKSFGDTQGKKLPGHGGVHSLMGLVVFRMEPRSVTRTSRYEDWWSTFPPVLGILQLPNYSQTNTKTYHIHIKSLCVLSP